MVEEILPHQIESAHRKNVSSKTKLMAFGSVSFSYILKLWWAFITALVCRSSAETPSARRILRATCKMRMRKRKGKRKKGFPCLQLLSTALNTLARGLSSGPILLGRDRSFVRASYPWRRSPEQRDADQSPSQPSPPRLVQTLISALQLQYYWRWDKRVMLARIRVSVFSSQFPLHRFSARLLKCGKKGKGSSALQN